MATLTDNKRAFYIEQLGLTQQEGAAMSLTDMEVLFFANPNIINQGTTELASLEQLMRVEIDDDGSPTSEWPDRLVFFFEGIRTGYFNEYGELRSRSAKLNTVALRALAHEDNVDTDIFQVTNHSQGAVYAAVSKLLAAFTVPIEAPNIDLDLLRTTDAVPINNSTVLVADNVMQFAVAAAGTYLVAGNIIYDCAAAADIKARFNFTGTGTGIFSAHVLTTAATASATNQGNFSARDLNSNFAGGGYGVGAANLATIPFRGILTATGAGTFSIQYAQNTADASDLTVRAGSHLSYRKVNS